MISRTKATVWWGMPTATAFAFWMFNTSFRNPGTGYLSVEFGVILLVSILFIAILGGGGFARTFNALVRPHGRGSDDRKCGSNDRK